MKNKVVVLKVNSSQYLVSEGDMLEIEKVEGEKGDKLSFNEVLLSIDGDNVVIGKPTIAKMEVKAEIVDQIVGPKILNRIYRAKSRYHKTKGHRQPYTLIKILSI